MGPRFDISGVPPQGGYIAKQCPVRAQNNTLRPCEPLAPSAAVERRFAQGRLFEAEVFEELVSLHPDAVVIARGSTTERESATAAAMDAGTALIIGGRLPSDGLGRRVGEPDLLVRTPDGGDATYRAVDVKNHEATSARPADAAPAVQAALTDPRLEAATPGDDRAGRKHRGDLLQLAHYQRMLEAAGRASSTDAWAGIIGVEGQVIWHDLDAKMWRTPSASGRPKDRTTMEVYDFEFAFRLDIIAVAQRSLVDPATAPLLVPVRVSECAECPWWVHCGPQLEAGAGDVSLVPGVGWRPWKTHQDHGVIDRRALARLDPRTARLVAAGVDVAAAIEVAAAVDPATPTADLGTHRGRAIVDDLLATKAAGAPLTEVVWDPGYSLCKPETTQHPLAAAGIRTTFTVVTHQRSPRPFSHGDALLVDGQLYSSHLPAELRDLPMPPRGASDAEKLAYEVKFDQRARWRLVRHSGPDPHGATRWRCPFCAGMLRARAFPKTMRRPATVPLVAVDEGTDGCCGGTLTAMPVELPLWQPIPFGTTAWRISMGRRQVVESANAALKGAFADLSRGFFRVFGRTKMTVLLGFSIAGYNLDRIRSFRAKQRAVADKAPGRPKRRSGTWNDLVDGAPVKAEPVARPPDPG